MKQQSSNLFGNDKNTRVSAKWSVITVLLLAALIALNALTSLLPSGIASPNVSGSSTFRISGTTVDWLRKLDEPVTLYFICEGGRANADGEFYSFLEKYEEASDMISLEVIDPNKDSLFIDAFGGTWPENLSIIVESQARYRILDNASLYYYRFYNASYGEMIMSPAEYQETQQMMSESDSTGQMLTLLAEGTTAHFDGESRVTNAINYVTEEKVAVAYLLTGNGTKALDRSLSDLLTQSCYELRTTLTVEALPDDCDLLIVNAPATDLSDAEATALATYLADGGKLFLTTSYAVSKLEKLNGVLQSYGLSYHENHGVLCDGNPAYYLSDSSAAYEYLFRAHINSAHAATGSFDGEFVVATPHAIAISEKDGVSVTPWLYTSGAGYLLTADYTTGSSMQVGEKGEYTLGAIAEAGETSIVWITSPLATLSAYDAYSEGGNHDLILSVFNHLTGIGHDGITVPSREIDTSTLAVTASGFLIWGFILVILLPVATAVTGGIVWYKRKKR